VTLCLRLFVALFLMLSPLAAQALPRVRMVTSAGAFVIELEAKRAPITAANFLAYVDDKRFDDTRFYRAARAKADPGRGFIQGGIQRNYRLMYPGITHEPTTKTGLSHVDGAISMARNAPGTAMGDFFITVGAVPSMDARGEYAGYAVFGRVISGMAVVRKILAAPIIPGAGAGPMKDQYIKNPVRIITARRVP
jgi:peptidyl-prolyl cis-trans isomerase A (cyclophilin A)